MNYLLIGPEEYLKRRFLEKLKKSVLNETSPAGLNFETFQAGGAEINEILNTCATLPFLSKEKLILIEGAEKFSQKEKDALLKYLKTPLHSTTLVLSSPLSAFNKFLAEASRFTKVIRYNRLNPSELNRWIRKEFDSRGKKIHASLAGLMIERSGEGLFSLKNEIEKITSFTKGAVEITERHVEAALGRAFSQTAFELVELILEGRPKEVFLAVDELLLKEKPHQILNLLAWRFRNLTGRFKKADLKKKFEIILEGDLSIKRGLMLPEDALFRVLVKLCG